MRALCDVCEAAPARLFCAADEAALCMKCDGKVHGCNKLASRHVRVELAEARASPRCDICENAPAFFFCGIDGTSLCLQCDMDVHIGGKKTHERYLLMGQRVEVSLPYEKEEIHGSLCDELPRKTWQDDIAGVKEADEQRPMHSDRHHHHHHKYHHHHLHNEKGGDREDPNTSGDWKTNSAPAVAIAVGEESQFIPNHRLLTMIDLNSRPNHLQKAAHTAKGQELASSDDECAGVVPELIHRSSVDSDNS